MFKSKKKVLALIMAVVIAVTSLGAGITFIPSNTGIVAEAMASDKSSISRGPSVLFDDPNTANAAVVNFGGRKWTVIGSQRTRLTLLAKTADTRVSFCDEIDSKSNQYYKSDLRKAVDNIANGLSDVEKSYIEPRTLESGSYDYINTDCVKGEEVKNAYLWPLSTLEAYCVDDSIRGINESWWTRSPGYEIYGNCYVSYVSSKAYKGKVEYTGSLTLLTAMVRPALFFKPGRLELLSDSKGGKGGTALSGQAIPEIPQIEGRDYRLTLKDDSRSNFYASTTKREGNKLTFTYGNAKKGENEYLSVLIVDKSGYCSHYARVLDLSKPVSEDKRVEITLPENLEEGSTIYVFNEQYNGGTADDSMNVDYSSSLKEISLNPSAASVTFDMNDHPGTAPSTQYFEYKGQKATEPTPAPTTKGYDFKGWYKDKECTEKWDFDTLVDDNITLYAKWELQYFTANVKIEGTPRYRQTLTAVVTDDNCSGVMNYVWYRDNEEIETTIDNTYILTEEDIGYHIRCNVIAYPQKEGEKVVSPATAVIQKGYGPIAPSGLEGVKPTTVANNDGKITGVNSRMEYSTDKQSENWISCPENEITGLKNGTYYVRYKSTATHEAGNIAEVEVPVHDDCIVTFDVQGIGTAPDDEYVKVNDLVTKPTDPTSDAFEFKGWYKDADCTTEWKFDTDRVTDDVTIYAKWEAKQEGTIAINKTNFPDDRFRACISSDFDKDNKGYLTAEQIKDITFIDVHDQDIYSIKGIEYFSALKTLVAAENKLTEVDLRNNKELESLILNNNDLTSIDLSSNKKLKDLEVAYNKNLNKLNISENEELNSLAIYDTKLDELDIRSNPKLVKLVETENRLDGDSLGMPNGWIYIDIESGSDSALAYDKSTALKAFTVSFEMNGHGEQVDPQVVDKDGKVQKPADPKDDILVFKGWYKEKECKNTWSFTKDTVDSNITLYAKWAEPKESYTLTFNTNGGSKLNPVTEEDGTTINLANYKPTKSGYSFAGWYYDAKLTKKVTSVKLTANMTVYAKWTALPMDNVTINTVLNSEYGIKFTWNKDKNADGYKIYRKANDKWEVIAVVKGADTTHYLDKQVLNGTRYTYAVRAYNASGMSNYETKTIIRVVAPQLTKAYNNSTGSVYASWQQNSQASGYVVSYSTGGVTKYVRTYGVASNTATLKNLQKGKTYEIQVRAYKTIGLTTTYSAWSQPKYVTIKK